MLGNLQQENGCLGAARDHFDQALHSMVDVGKALKQPTTAMCIYKQARLSLQENNLENARSVRSNAKEARCSLKTQQISTREVD